MDLAAALGSLSSVGLSTGVGLLVAIVLALLALSLVTYIPSGSIPRTIASGSWNATALNTGRWRVPITFTNASTHTSFAGSYIAILANGLGAFWVVDRSFVLYNQGGAVVTRPVTWGAGQTVTVVMDLRTSTGSITISGATTGNGTYTFTNTGTYFVAAEALGIGVYSGGGFNLTGSIGQVDDADDSLSFSPLPAPSTGALAAGSLTSGGVSLSGAALGGTAGAEQPALSGGGILAVPAAPSTGALGAGALTPGGVSRSPDPAPSTGGRGAGALSPGAVALAGAALGSTAGAEQPTATSAGLILAPLPAPSTGALGAGQLAGGAASIGGAALSGTAGASKPAAAFLGLVLVLPQVPRVLRAIGSGPRSLRALGSGPRSLRALGSGPRNLREV